MSTLEAAIDSSTGQAVSEVKGQWLHMFLCKSPVPLYCEGRHTLTWVLILVFAQSTLCFGLQNFKACAVVL
jgi:hypothetical protein